MAKHILDSTPRKLVAMLIAASLGAGFGLLVSVALRQTFQAESRLFVNIHQLSSANSNAYTESLASQERVKSYADLVSSDRVLDQVISQLKLPTRSDALSDEIVASVPEDTVLLDIRVRDPSPQKAQEIANAVAESVIGLVDELERPLSGEDAAVQLKVVDEASVPREPVSPRTKFNVVLGAFLGLVLGGSALFLWPALKWGR
jgi:capsular polysaccharide biosynthesis protein